MTTREIEEATALGIAFDERDGIVIATTQDGEVYYLDHADQIAPMLQDVRDRSAH